MTIDYAAQTWVLSLPALRRLRFPINGKAIPEADTAARNVLVALALCAYTHSFNQGFDLRSRCLLVSEGAPIFELVAFNGVCTEYKIDSEDADELLAKAVAEARSHGFIWNPEPVVLQPESKLVELIHRSRNLPGVAGD